MGLFRGEPEKKEDNKVEEEKPQNPRKYGEILSSKTHNNPNRPENLYKFKGNCGGKRDCLK